jgi:hypothetical protein
MRWGPSRSALAALCLGISGAAFAADEALAPDDFAWGRTLETPNGDALQTLLLDLPVYRGSVGPELVDLRVWNGAGEVVPHAIRALADPSEQEGALIGVPLFRVPEDSALARKPLGSVRERDVDIEVAADGAIVRVAADRTDRDPADTAVRPPSAYLIDVSQLAEQKRAIEGLLLTLAPDPAEFAMALRVEASDDLVHFESIAARAALARLDQAGHRIEQSEVAFRAIACRYLLVSGAQPLPVEVLAVRARLAPVIDPPPRQHTRIEGVHAPGERAEYLFDLGGAIPVDRVQVELPAANTVVEAALYSAADPSGPWLHHHSGVLYQLDHRDGALRNAEIGVPPIRQRYFKLEVDEKGGGLGSGIPALEVAWMPEQLLFVARGAGPFALGYGRAQVAGSRFDASELIQSALPPGADPRRDLPRETAKLGPQRAVGDPSVLEPRSEPPSARTLALWGVLVGSVAVVLALSVRLLRRMGPA